MLENPNSYSCIYKHLFLKILHSAFIANYNMVTDGWDKFTVFSIFVFEVMMYLWHMKYTSLNGWKTIFSYPSLHNHSNCEVPRPLSMFSFCKSQKDNFCTFTISFLMTSLPMVLLIHFERFWRIWKSFKPNVVLMYFEICS